MSNGFMNKEELHNVIYINPEKDIVVAVASYFKPRIFDRVDFIQEYMEPSVCE